MTGTTPPHGPADTDEVWAESFELVIDLLVGLAQRLDRLEAALSRPADREPGEVSRQASGHGGNGRGGHPSRRGPRRLVAFLRR